MPFIFLTATLISFSLAYYGLINNNIILENLFLLGTGGFLILTILAVVDRRV